MGSAHDETVQGLQEMLDYIKGDKSKGRSKLVTVTPLRSYSKEEIKSIRNQHNMTLKMFAEVLGVSQKTVEAWETGTNSPTGSAVRLLQLLEMDSYFLDHMLIRN